MRTLQSQIGWCTRTQWALGAILVAGLAAFYFAGYRPLAGRLAALDSRISADKAELAANQARLRDLPQLAVKVEKLQAKVERSKKLPASPELGQFIKDLTQLGQQSSLRGMAVQPMGSRRLELFYELPICLSFEGNFADAAIFLRQMEDLQRLTRVRRLKVDTKDERAGVVSVEMTMNLYFAEGL